MTDHHEIKIDRNNETRTKDISKMISEGGLGADDYYTIVKGSNVDKEAEKTDE